MNASFHIQFKNIWGTKANKMKKKNQQKKREQQQQQRIHFSSFLKKWKEEERGWGGKRKKPFKYQCAWLSIKCIHFDYWFLYTKKNFPNNPEVILEACWLAVWWNVCWNVPAISNFYGLHELWGCVSSNPMIE